MESLPSLKLPPPENPLVMLQGEQSAHTPDLRLGHLRFSMEWPFSTSRMRAEGLFFLVS